MTGVTHMDTPHPKDTFVSAAAVAQQYSTAMGDPLYALQPRLPSAIVYAGVVTTLQRLVDEAATLTADPDTDDEGMIDAHAMHALAVILRAADDRADEELDGWPWDADHDDTHEYRMAYGHAMQRHLHVLGLPVGPPKIERGWSRGPRWVLPYPAA